MKLQLQDRFLLLDGGMGTQLQAKGLPLGGVPELWNIERPADITAVHRAYVEAGSQVVYTNTFGCNRLKMERTGHTVKELIEAAVACARAAGPEYVALDIGPIGHMLEPTGTLRFEEAYDIFREQIEAGQDADLIVFETMSDLLEVRAGLLAAREHGGGRPVLVTMSFEENGRTFIGCSVASMALTLEGLGADAIGVNCSLGPEELVPIVQELCRWTTLPVIVKPNAGLPDPVTNTYHFTPERFGACIRPFVEMGAVVFGGCCGTTPDHIRALRDTLAEMTPVPRETHIPSAVCSAGKVVTITEPRIIGERINPTGKKRFKQALLEHDIDYILNQAIQQINIEGENRELKAVIEGLKHSQGKAGELPYGTAYFPKFAQNSSLLKKVCDVGYDVDSVSYDKATGLIRYNRFTRAVDDDQLYAFHVELSYPDNTERIYKITKITEKPFQTVELKFKNARTTMLPIATYSTDDYYRRLVCKQLQLPEYAHLKQPGWGPIPLLDPPLYTDKLNMKRIDGMLYCSLADTEDGLANLLFPSFAVRYDPQRKVLEEADILYTDSWIPARTEYLPAIPYLDFLYHDGNLENP